MTLDIAFVKNRRFPPINLMHSILNISNAHMESYKSMKERKSVSDILTQLHIYTIMHTHLQSKDQNVNPELHACMHNAHNTHLHNTKRSCLFHQPSLTTMISYRDKQTDDQKSLIFLQPSTHFCWYIHCILYSRYMLQFSAGIFNRALRFRFSNAFCTAV